MTTTPRRTYVLRMAQSNKNSVEVTFPYEVVARAARIRGMTVPEFLKAYQTAACFGEGEEVTYILEKR